MRSFVLVLAFCAVGSLADGIHRARGGHFVAQGRQGRQESSAAVAPLSGYGAALNPPLDAGNNGGLAPAGLGAQDAANLGAYGEQRPTNGGFGGQVSTNGGFGGQVPSNGGFGGQVPSNGGFGGQVPTNGGFGGQVPTNGGFGGQGATNGGLVGSPSAVVSEQDSLAALEEAIPGAPDVDYPILAAVPETAFSCDGQIDGGYYADPEARCQVFHICTADGHGGLSKYSFLCPNGTIFNQNYLICDWWFNFDCSEASALYSINQQIADEREKATAAAAAAAANSHNNGANGNGNKLNGNGNGNKLNGNGGSQGIPAAIPPQQIPIPAQQLIPAANEADFSDNGFPQIPAASGQGVPAAGSYGAPIASNDAAQFVGGAADVPQGPAFVDQSTYANRQGRARQGLRQQQVQPQVRSGRRFQG